MRTRYSDLGVIKNIWKAIAGLFLISSVGTGVATAETISSVMQYSYDFNNHTVCDTVRMNPTTFGSLPADPCALGTTSAFGTDRITKTVYDVAGQVSQVIQAYGTPDQRVYSSFVYSPNGKVIDTVDANGNRTHMEYDGFDRLVTYRYPSPIRPTAFSPTTAANAIATAGAYSSTDYEAYTYDDNNNKLTTRRRDGQVLTDCYDALNRSITHYLHAQSGCTATGGAADVYTSYDLQGHILSKRFASFSGAGVSYAYDGLGRVTSTTDMNNRTVGYEYNTANARTKLTYPDSVYIGYGLDNANRMISAGWNATSNLFGLSYDNQGHLATIAKGSVASTSYGYDGIGRLTSMTNDLSGTANDVTWSFNNYNPAGQIASWSASSSFYDNVERVSVTDARNYDGLNRDGTLVGTSTACPAGGYDARGNLICDGVRSFTYDVENRLLTATGGSAALTLGYDPEGRLYRYTAGSSVTTFLYDGTDLIGEYSGDTPTVLRRYIHGSATDDPIIWTEGVGSAVHFLWSNYQGSVIAYSDAFGVIGDTYKYGPYGEPKNLAGMDSWSGFRFRYTGQVIIPEAKLYYYKARVYDPTFGRFLQTDPVGSKDDLDLYAYVGGDPINHSDPTGLYICNGSDASCGRFGSDLATLQKAASAKGTTDAERKAINTVLGAYGKAGEKNGVTVQFGRLSGNAAGNTSGTKGNITVTLDYAKIDKYGSTSADRKFLGASVTAHEGGHVDDRANGRFSISSYSYVNGQDGAQCQASYCVSVGYYRKNEISAFTTQAIINNALNYRSGLVPSDAADARQRGYNEGNQECESSTANGVGNCSY